MALNCHPSRACSFNRRSSLSPDILPPIIFSRTSTTLYAYNVDLHWGSACTTTVARAIDELALAAALSLTVRIRLCCRSGRLIVRLTAASRTLYNALTCPLPLVRPQHLRSLRGPPVTAETRELDFSVRHS